MHNLLVNQAIHAFDILFAINNENVVKKFENNVSF